MGLVCLSLSAGDTPGQETAPVDTTDVYASKTNVLLSLPRLVWNAMVYPLGRFMIYEEQSKLRVRVAEWFVNADGTFGVFPQLQLGGETGTGGGFRVFHSNLAGRGKQVEAVAVYSGKRGQMARVLYNDPALRGDRVFWRMEGDFLRTDNRNATINGAIRDDPARRFRVARFDGVATLGWRRYAGGLEAYRPNVYLESRAGFGWRDFSVKTGHAGPLDDPGSTAKAHLLSGLGEDLALSWFGGRVAYDDRDYRPPIRDLPHPFYGYVPGQAVAYFDGLYHHFRDLSYPGRGGLYEVSGDYVMGSEGMRFVRLVTEVQRFVPLFRPGRVLGLRARLEKVFPAGGTVPYTDLVVLQGNRGYRRGFFRGEGALLLNVEYRYPIWDTWHAYVFWDGGQVFDGLDEAGLDRFEKSWGGGIALRTATSLLVRVQAGHSAAQRVLLGFSFDQGF